MREDPYADEVCDAGLSAIEELKDGTLRLSLDIPSAYFKFIIGKKAETKRRIENETRTQIQIPRQGVEGEVGKMELSKLCHHRSIYPRFYH